MNSSIAEALALTYSPVALILTHDKPSNAIQFKEGKFGCVMTMLAAAARGKQTVFDRMTFGCPGGGTGLGFGNQYKNILGGEESFCQFLSTGNVYHNPGIHVTEDFNNGYVYGEAYVKTPELVRDFLDYLPITDIPFEYVVFKPLNSVDIPSEGPTIIIFLADVDQLSALVVLANYGMPGRENVIIPFAAGCQAIGIFPYQEATSKQPRAVLGLVDISARVQIKRQLKEDVMSFAVPFTMFQEMEANVPGSFLERNTWKELRELRSKGT
jgi:uncharacterized protein (DUF169 family)